MHEILTNILMGGAAVFFAGFIGFLAVGLYTNVFERFLTEVKEESAGGMSGAGSVVIRKLGVANRRFMWPTYEESRRRALVKSGEPNGYKPEDIMALQEIGFVGGLIFGLILCNSLGFSLAGGLAHRRVGSVASTRSSG